MKSKTTTKATLCLGTAISLALGSTDAAPKKPASIDEMWKIIQQQQKEIENLKAKSSENESLRQEISVLKETQKSQEKAISQANAPQSATNVAVSKAGKGDLERKTDVLANEVEKLKTQLYIPESREYKSQYGLGPAASNVYGVSRGI